MAAFTEGFSDTSQPGKDHIGSVISKVLAARRMAREERELAEEKAQKAGYDNLEEVGVKKGFFFKAALKSKLGGSYLSGKKQDFQQAIDRVKLLRNPRSQFWNFIDNRDADGKEVKKLSDIERFRKQFDNYAFVSAKRPPENVDPEEEIVPDTEGEVASSISGGTKKISREQLLSAVLKITDALEKTASSISKTSEDGAAVASNINAMQQNVVSQISERTGTLEDKLDAIVNAINNQTNFQKQTIDQAEDKQAEANIEQERDAASTVSFDDISTKTDESLEISTSTQQEQREISSLDDPYSQRNAWREEALKQKGFEKGGIASGPDSGYLAKLHGDELIIPLDNNYTQGEPSAVDGKVAPKKYEKGTTSGSLLGSKTGFKNRSSFTPMSLPGITPAGSSGMSVDKMVQPLMDVMTLPALFGGGYALSAMIKMMQIMGPQDKSISAEIAKIASPLADVFGLPNSIVNKAKDPGLMKEDKKKDGEKKDDEKSGLVSKLLTMISKIVNKVNDGGGGGGRPSDNRPGSLSGTGVSGLAEFIGSKESGNSYTKLVGGAEDSSILGKTVTELYDEKGGQFAMGRYQIQMRTAKGILERNDIDPSTFKFDEAGQDKLFKMLLVHRGLNEYLSGEITEDQFLLNLSMEWAALPKDSSGAGYYDGDGRNRALLSYSDSIQMIKGLKDTSGADPDSPDGTRPDLETPDPENPSPRTPVTPKPKKKTAQDITQNFGMSTHDKMQFVHGGKTYEAYKTKKGFDVYEVGGGQFFGSRKIPANEQTPELLKSLITAGSRRSTRRVEPPSRDSRSSADKARSPADMIREQTQSSAGGNREPRVAMINIGSGGKSSNINAGTFSPPSSQESTLSPGKSQGLESFYNPNTVA